MIESWTDVGVLVTGGAGFLGSHVVDRLQARGARVIVPRSTVVDLRSPEACAAFFREHRPEVVIHAAVDGGGIGYMRAHPASVGVNNLLMNTNVLQASAEVGVRVFVGVSSICAYPRDAAVPMREQDLWTGYPEPTNGSYGISKRVMMSLGEAFREQYGLNAVFPMPVNLYGPRDDFDPRSSHVVPALIRRFLEAREEGREEVVAWGSGRVTRELLYVEDCADAIVLAAERLDRSEPFNLGTGVELTVASIAEAVAKAVGYEGRIRWDASQPDGQPRKLLDVSRAADWLGWRARVDLGEGLRRTVAWYLAQGGRAA
jgi:GDP-L-fucose synthase